MSVPKKTIKNKPRTEAQNIDASIPVFTDGVSKPAIHSYKRGEDTSVRGEEIKNISIGIKDIDEAVLYYFNEVIKPYVVNDGTTYSIPVIYSDPEKWKSSQKDGYFRDKDGKVLLPVIAIKRENMEKVRNITNKLDGNRSNIYQVYEKRYTQKNQYDNFSILTNRAPVKEYYNIVVPDYYTITYSCAIYVSYIEDLNKIIESIGYRSDSYWGMPNKFLFKATIDNFPITNQISDGEDRRITSVFTLTMNGYLTPSNIDKQLASNPFKSRSKTQVIFTMEATGDDLGQINVTSATNSSMAKTAYISEGVNVYNNFTLGTLNSDIIAYLNKNVDKKANYVVSSSAAFYNASMLQTPSGSNLPDTSKTDFKFFANGVYIQPEHVVSFDTSGSALVLTVNTATLGYSFTNTFEIIAVGKFA